MCEPILVICNQILVERADDDFVEKTGKTRRAIRFRSFTATPIGTPAIVRLEHNFVLLLMRAHFPAPGIGTSRKQAKITPLEAGWREVAFCEASCLL
jgi:hypothetical protein